jgi:hypothetical protein
MHKKLPIIALLALLTPPAICMAAGADEEHWTPLFNGKNLDGWVTKFAGYQAGENPGNIFRVEDGLLTVSYDDVENFGGEFGHIFVDRPFSSYRFRCEFRFVGDQLEGGPDWAYANSGVMLHSQSPQSMEVDQKFPDSFEFQLLGRKEGQERSMGNLFRCGGTLAEVDGMDSEKRMTPSAQPAHPPGEWVSVEAEVRGDQLIRHIVNGKTVLEYTNLRNEDGSPRKEGFIALQAETHPIQFRKIEILVLDDDVPPGI